MIEIENLLNFQLIDMEFALVENKIFVLQIRPLVINEKLIDDKEINKYIRETNSEIKFI